MAGKDICFKNGPIVSVDFFKDVVMPRYKRINKKLKAVGIDIWFTDCDGDVRPILPYFLEGGINCLFPFEVNGCAHPAELLNQYGKELHIMGGVDKIQLAMAQRRSRPILKRSLPGRARRPTFPSAIIVARRTSNRTTTSTTSTSKSACSG